MQELNLKMVQLFKNNAPMINILELNYLPAYRCDKWCVVLRLKDNQCNAFSQSAVAVDFIVRW